jgi:alpha-tubulin suppressor-like RCC1 family protein
MTYNGGSSHSLARKTDGTLWSWGFNGQGRLGDGTIIHRSSPVQVPGTQWNDVSGGMSFTSTQSHINKDFSIS